ncbi:MAG: hypothetical protein AAF827_09565 [Cyanobacteria bacterium P01_D01_bin.6]
MLALSQIFLLKQRTQANHIEDVTPLRSRSLGNNPVEEISSLANLYALEELLLFNTLVTECFAGVNR